MNGKRRITCYIRTVVLNRIIILRITITYSCTKAKVKIRAQRADVIGETAIGLYHAVFALRI